MNQAARLIAVLLVVFFVYIPLAFASSENDSDKDSCSDCFILEDLKTYDHICMIIDRSGSMAGEPINRTKEGAKAFIKKMKTHSSLAVITFNQGTELVQDFTEDKALLSKKIDEITVDGNTALNDAIAYGALKLQPMDGRKIIVFLTDGRDNNSRYSLDDIRKMNISEGIFVYGIAMGDADTLSLSELCSATAGRLEYTDIPTKLKDLYPLTLSNYYAKFGNSKAAKGDMVIRSLPDNRPVYIDGKLKGNTPTVIQSLEKGTYKVEVDFETGKALCKAQVKGMKRTDLDLRPPVLGRDLIVTTSQSSTAVFFNGAYMGTTSMGGNKLKIKNAPEGKHTLKLICMPDFDFGPEQVMEIPISLVSDVETAGLRVNVLRQKILESYNLDTEFTPMKKDHFSQLDMETGDF